MNNPEEYFIRQALFFARNLPLKDSVVFLRGLLMSCGDTPQTKDVRDLFVNLQEADRQIEMISTGQLKLTFTELAKQ